MDRKKGTVEWPARSDLNTLAYLLGGRGGSPEKPSVPNEDKSLFVCISNISVHSMESIPNAVSFYTLLAHYQTTQG